MKIFNIDKDKKVKESAEEIIEKPFDPYKGLTASQIDRIKKSEEAEK